MAWASPSLSWTMVTPMVDPSDAGFTTKGKGKFNFCTASFTPSGACKMWEAGVGIAWAAKIRLDMILSMDRALARTPEPV